jgi:hypothetical protein
MTFPNPLKLVWSMALHLWAGWRGWEVIASPEAQNVRLMECFDCDSWDFDTAQCRKCGCLVAVKCMMALEKCPRRKWFREWRRKNPVVPRK